jgi:predicted nucleotidyltransferase
VVTFQPILDLLRARVPGLAAVYLFGSSETGDTHAASDLDLAVLSSSRLEPMVRWELQGDLAARAGRSVDLVDLRSASAVMRMQVVSTGRLLLSIDPAEVDRFEMFVYADYCRLNEERRAILDDVKRRGRIHA